MAPTSYRGPLESDAQSARSHSQIEPQSFGRASPGIRVEDILRHKGDGVHSVSPGTLVRDVVGALHRLRIGAMVIADPEKRPIGIFSERDLVRLLETVGVAVLDQPVESVMTPNPACCAPDHAIEGVIKAMNDGGFRHMPVQEDGVLCGLVSVRDVIQHRLREVEYENLKIKQAIVG